MSSPPSFAETPDSSRSNSYNVWADQPSHPSKEVAILSADFADLDPFAGEHGQRELKGEEETWQHEQVQEPEVEDSRDGAQQQPAPPTPQKPIAPPLPGKATEPPASAIYDLTQQPSATTSYTPQTAAPSTPTLKSAPIVASSSSSGLPNPLASIASAFRKRPNVGAAFPSSSSTPTSRPTTPTKAKAPVMLTREKDETDHMDDSEKEAPQAIPEGRRPSAAGEGSREGEEGGSGSYEEDGPPFDFNLFLEQMRNRAADPIAKYLRSFLKEFAKRTWSVNDQIRVINDFLDFIAAKMRENEIWKSASEKEFDNAVEAMEKLVMNRLYHLTFIPALSSGQQATTQTDDLGRDHVLSQRIRLFGWVNESHLDLPKTEDSESFIEFAKQELLKVNMYKAPRDKLICILNCCKVIFGLMRHLAQDDGADTFIPFLILVVLRANPSNLISNVQYIQRFRNPERLAGENGYYLSSLNGAISFIETMDSSSLSGIDQAEFERLVEEAIASLPVEEEPQPEQEERKPQAETASQDRTASTSSSAANSPRKGRVADSTFRPVDDAQSPSLLQTPAFGRGGPGPMDRPVSPAEATRDFIYRSSDNLTKTVSKPLQALGRIFTEMGSDSDVVAGVPRSDLHSPRPHLHNQESPSRRTAHNQATPRRANSSARSPTSRRGYQPAYIPYEQQPNASQFQQRPHRAREASQGMLPETPSPLPPGYQPADYLDDSISAEQVQQEADRQYSLNHGSKLETLQAIFPNMDKETLEIVLLSNEENVETTIERLLEMQ